MGKSRAVDEMSKFHFVIPINLAQEFNSAGILAYSLRFPSMLNVLVELQDILLQTVQQMNISLGAVGHKEKLSSGAAHSSTGYVFRQLLS